MDGLNAELMRRAIEEQIVIARYKDLEAADRGLPSADDRAGQPHPPERPQSRTLFQLSPEPDDPDEVLELIRINDENCEWFCALVADIGWPGVADGVTEGGQDAAWLHAQHADKANAVRAGWLPLVLEAVRAGRAHPRHYIDLVDRIAYVGNRPQEFGTLSTADGPYRELSVAEDEVDARRAELGLPTMAEDRAAMGAGVDLLPLRAEFRAALGARHTSG